MVKAYRDFLVGIESFFRPMQTRQRRIDEVLAKSDAEALRSDWETIGQDIKNAMTIYEKDYKKYNGTK